jgi:hypothetical protein
VVDFKLHASHLSWPAATVVARMKEMPVTGTLFGPAIVRRDGRMVHDMYLVEVKKPGESRSDWDSYKVLRKASLQMSPSYSLVFEANDPQTGQALSRERNLRLRCCAFFLGVRCYLLPVVRTEIAPTPIFRAWRSHDQEVC